MNISAFPKKERAKLLADGKTKSNVGPPKYGDKSRKGKGWYGSNKKEFSSWSYLCFPKQRGGIIIEELTLDVSNTRGKRTLAVGRNH